MPPSSASSKAELAAQEAAIQQLSKREQTELLGQALLREYMHRKGFRATMAAFDAECPRGGLTIASRALMEKLMALGDVVQRNKAAGGAQGPRQGAPPPAGGTSLPSSSSSSVAAPSAPLQTFMEILCSYRLRKRHIAGALRAGGGGAEAADYDSSEEEREVAQRLAAREALLRERREAAAKGASESNGKKKEKKEKKKDKKKDKSGTGARLDPHLAAAMQTLSGLPVAAGAGSSADGGGPLSTRRVAGGRRWTPGSDVPAIGLSVSSSSSAGGGKESDSGGGAEARRPTFVAGSGMTLMANTRTADPTQTYVPRDGSGGAESSGEDVPSPYRNITRAVYDPHATARGALAAAAAAAGAAAKGGGAASLSPARAEWGGGGGIGGGQGSPTTREGKGFGFATGDAPVERKSAKKERRVRIME